MSTEIDKKIVEMEFDNSNFEKNTKETMSTLQKLKSALTFGKESKSMEELNKSAEKVDVSPIGQGVEAIKLKFSALQVSAFTVMQDITRTAEVYGKRIISAFTIDPIKTGFQEYETQINAVQTILANTSSKGTTLDQVNAALDELNTYADKTIYNFTEMTRNIGTFTAAGVDLDTSTKAIKGIANLAAVSGSTSQQASTAMYQLSQALAAGTVKLQDWNSVVNAGMGGQVFQDSLKETAKLHGIKIDEMIEAEGSFRETLSEGWLTKDILLETLNKFTGDLSEAELKQKGYTDAQIKDIMKLGTTANDAATKVKTFTQLVDTLKEAAQSGWTQTWELIIGDFDEAKEVFTNISDVIGKVIGDSADARNAFVGSALTSKWSQFETQINNAGIKTEDYKKELAKTVKANGKNLDSLIEKYGSLDKVMKSGSITSSEIRTAFNTISDNALKTSASLKGSEDKLKDFQKTVNDIWNGDYKNSTERVEALTKAGYNYNTVQNLVNKTVKGQEVTLKDLSDAQLENLGYTKDQIKNIKEVLTLRKLSDESKSATSQFGGLMENINQRGGRELLIESLNNSLESFTNIVTAAKDAWGKIFPKTSTNILYELIKRINSLTERFKTFTSTLSLSDKNAKNIRRTFDGIIAILSIFKKAISTVYNALKPVIKSLGRFAELLLEGTAKMGDWAKGLNKNTKEVSNFSKVLNGATSFLSNILDNLRKMFGGIGEFFVKVFEKVMDLGKKLLARLGEIFGKIGESFKSSFDKKNFDLSGVASIITSGGLVALILKLKKMFGGLSENVEGLFDIVKNIVSPFKSVLDNLSGAVKAWKQSKQAETLKTIAVAILLLSISLLLMSTIDSDKLTDAIGALIFLVGALASASKLMGGGGLRKAGSQAISALSIAASLLIMAFALKTIASIDERALDMSIIAIAAILGEIVAFNKLLSSEEKDIDKVARSMIYIGIALKIFASVLSDLAKIDTVGMFAGVIAIGLLMLEMDMFVALIKTEEKALNRAAISMIILGVALKIMASVISDLANIELMGVVVGVVAIGILLLELQAFINSIKSDKTIFLASIALIIVGSALKIIANVMKDLSEISFGGIIKSLIPIIVIFALLTTMAEAKISKDIIQLGVALNAVMSSFGNLANGLKQLATLEWYTIVLGIAAMIVPLLVMAAILKTISKNKIQNDAGNIFVTMAGSLMIIANAMVALGKLDIVGGIVAIGVLASAFAIMFGAVKLLAPLADKMFKVAGGIAVMAASFLAMGVGLIGISLGLVFFIGAISTVILMVKAFDFWDLAKALLMVVGIFVAIGGVAKLLRPVIPSMLALAGTMFLLGISMAAIAASITVVIALLGVLSRLKTDEIAAAMVNVKDIVLKMVDILLAALMRVIDGLKDIIFKVIKTLKEVTPELISLVFDILIRVLKALADKASDIVGYLIDFVIGLIDTLTTKIPQLMDSIFKFISTVVNYVIQALNSMDSEKLKENIINFGIVALLMKVFSKVGRLLVPAMKGVAAVGVIIGEMIAILAIIGGISEMIPGLKGFIEEGGEILSKLGEAIGGLIGGLIGGIVEGVGKAIISILPDLGTALSTFTNNAQDFITGVGKIDDNFGQKVAALVGGVLGLTIAEFLNGITSIFTIGNGGLPELGSKLSLFATNAGGFFKAMADLDVESMRASGYLADALIKITAAELMNSIAGFIGGGTNMADFGSQIESFGSAIVSFSNIVKGNIDTEAVETAAHAGSIMAELNNSLPKTGGVVQWFLGETMDFATFGSQMVAFGASMVLFSKSVDGNINTEAVKIAANAGDIMLELQNKLPETGGVVQWFMGEKDLGKFGDQISSFGSSIASFVKTLSTVTISPTQVALARYAGEMMLSLQKHLPETGGVVQWFTGTKDLSSLGTNMVVFGEATKRFAKSLEKVNIPQSTLDTCAKIGPLMDSVNKAVPNSGGLIDSFIKSTFGVKDYNTFGLNLSAYGAAIGNFSNTISEYTLNKEKISEFCDAGMSIGKMAEYVKNTFGKDFFTNLGDALGGDSSGMKNFGTNMGTLADEIKSFSDKVSSDEMKLDDSRMNTYIDVLNRVTNIASQVKSVDTGSIREFSDMVNLLAGLNITGLIDKMSASEGSVYTFGHNFATGLRDAIAKEKDSLSAEIETLVQGIIEPLNGLYADALQIASNNFNNSQARKEIIDTIKEISNDMIDEFKNPTGANNLKTTWIDVAKNILKDFSDGFISYSATMATGFKTSINYMFEYTKSEDVDKILSDSSGHIVSKFMEGLKSKETLNSLQESVKTYISKFTSTIKEYNGDTQWAAGKKIFEPAYTAIDNFLNDLGGKYNSFYEKGKYVIEGLSKGINDKSKEISDSSRKIGELLLKQACTVLGIKSPSKEFEKIGKFSMMGLANGIQKNTEIVTESSANAGKTALETVNDYCYQIANHINDDFNPRIKPVLDLTDIVNGSKQLPSILNGVDIDTNMQARVIASELSYHGVPNQNGTTNEMASEIKMLREDMYNIVDAISGLEMRMDSGELVGAIAKPMDSALGARARMLRRS